MASMPLISGSLRSMRVTSGLCSRKRSIASRPLDACERGEPFEAGLGGKDLGSGFFQKCLAKSRGSAPGEQQVWREGIYEQVREVMPLAILTADHRQEGCWRRCAHQ